jgi:hypothetical protein
MAVYKDIIYACKILIINIKYSNKGLIIVALSQFLTPSWSKRGIIPPAHSKTSGEYAPKNGVPKRLKKSSIFEPIK